MPAEFEINGIEYRCGKMDAMTQWHISRRLFPVLPAIQKLATAWKGTMDEKMAALESAGLALAKLPDEANDYVIDHAMKITFRKDGSTWAPVWNSAAKRPMYDDIGMGEMLNIVGNVLAAEFAAFFPQAAQSSPR